MINMCKSPAYPNKHICGGKSAGKEEGDQRARVRVCVKEGERLRERVGSLSYGCRVNPFLCLWRRFVYTLAKYWPRRRIVNIANSTLNENALNALFFIKISLKNSSLNQLIVFFCF